MEQSNKQRRRSIVWAVTAALATVAASVILAAPAPAQTSDPSTAPAAAADAYGLFVNASLTPLGLPVDVGPLARATQEAPPEADNPAQAQVLSTGQVPAGGALVENIGVLQSLAGANLVPQAAAVSQAVDVALINQGGTPLITADLVRAVSSTDCTNDPSADGTEFVDLRVAGQADPIPTPAPNTELAPQVFNPLGLRVILNEQHPTADGRGLVVNAIHIYQVTPALVPPLFTGDVVVAHAMSTVNCPNGSGTTGGDNAVFIVKDVDENTARPGDTLTYTATVQNKSTSTCPVTQFIEHLPVAFEFVSTSGAFGTTATSVNRPGGGVDLVLEPEGTEIPAGGSATQTFVVKVKADAAPAVYFNNVEIFCANLGNWVKGLDAPVEVLGETPTTTTPTTAPPGPVPPPDDILPETGATWPTGRVLGLAALAAGLAALAARRRTSPA